MCLHMGIGVESSCPLSVYARKLALFLTLLWLATGNATANKPLRIGGSGTDLGTMEILCKALSDLHSDVMCEIYPSLGSGGGVRAVLANKLDVGLTSRPLKLSERSPELRVFNYAKTPLVFAVAESNPTKSVSQAQLGDLYSGTQLYWPGGMVARPVLRPKSDSDTLLVEQAIPQLKSSLNAARQRRGVPVAATDQDAADMLVKVPGAFGTTTLTLILTEQYALKPLTLDNVAPTIENVANGSYRVHKELFFVVHASLSPRVQRFLRFVQSPEGKDILARTGHIAVEFTAR